jgi:hypothetical protein
MSRKSARHEENSKKEDKLNKLELKISEILAEISSQNSNVEYNPDDPFSTVSPPKVTIQYFFKRIQKYSKIEKSTLIIILIYADRMCTTSGIILNPHNIHRIILGCLLLAIKYNEDVYFTNEHYAKVGGIPIQELNQLEYFSIQLLNFNLYISEDIYQKYLKYITNYSSEKR